jgi:hypothetical protein
MTHKEIKKWLDWQQIERYTIRPDGVVDVNGSASIQNFQGSIIPIQFGTVTGEFSCAHSGVTSLKGAPYHTGEGFYCYDTNLITFDGLSQFIGGDLGAHYPGVDMNIISLSGIDRVVKHIGGRLYVNRETTHILGLLLIEGIKEFTIDRDGPIDNIMNKYVGTGDILSAQDELIDAGFIDQARL